MPSQPRCEQHCTSVSLPTGRHLDNTFNPLPTPHRTVVRLHLRPFHDVTPRTAPLKVADWLHSLNSWLNSSSSYG